MKKYGKLLIAFMWLGLTMIMIVGATFAWFSENRQVEADGMKVQAEVASNLLITNSGKASYDFAADATNTATTELSPASTTMTTTALQSGNFFYADRTHIAYSTGAAGADTVFSAVAAANIATDAAASGDKTYVSKNTFYIKAEGDETKKIESVYVDSVVVTGASEEISSSLRVAVVCDSNVFLFAPVSGYTATYKGIASAATGLTNAQASANETITASTGGTSSTTKIGEIATIGTTELTVVIYVWYEGQDANCTSTNSIDTEELSVKVVFKCTDPVAKN